MQLPIAVPIIMTAAATLASSAPAAAQRQIYTARLTAQEPGASTGLQQQIQYRNPGDPAGKPYAVREITFALPPGASVDTTVPARCPASEAEFQARGADACPTESRVGHGALSADVGAESPLFPRLITTDVTFFNNQDQLILFAQSTNTQGPPIRVASRIAIREKRLLVTTVPPLPGAPPPEPYLALKDVANDLPPLEVAGKHYITTPPTCPPSRHWTITATFTYRDGVVETVESRTPCRGRAGPLGAAPADPSPPAGPRAAGPRIQLRGVPRACVAGGLRLRVKLTSEAEVRRAELALDGRRLLTTARARFSRRIGKRRLRPGRHRLTVVAVDHDGNRSVLRRRFRVCARR